MSPMKTAPSTVDGAVLSYCVFLIEYADSYCGPSMSNSDGTFSGSASRNS